MRSVIQRTFEGFKLDSKKVNQNEIFRNLDNRLLTEFRLNLEKKLDQESLYLLRASTTANSVSDSFQQEKKIAHAMTLDLGSYPIIPYVTQEYQKSVKQTYFAPPSPRNDLVVIKKAEFETEYNAKNNEASMRENSFNWQNPEFQLFQMTQVTKKEFMETIDQINSAVLPFAKEIHNYDKILGVFLSAGLFVVLFFSILLGLLSSWNIAIVLCSIYFFFLLAVISWVKKKQNQVHKYLIFNLALVCRNETDRYFAQHEISVKPGFQGKWIEFQYDNTGINIPSSAGEEFD